jgi:hypothetical protein
MQLKHLTIAELIAGAGGDPWEVNRTLQAGSPAQIERLAEAFHGAGRHTAEADHAFAQAQQRFNAAWNHQDGKSPINDSDEVQRTVKSLGAQSEQLPKIGADLENIAAALADAQKAGAQDIATLEGQLEQIDHMIDLAEQDLRDHPDAESQQELQAIIKALKRAAVNDTKDALGQLHTIRDGYAQSLHQSQTNLANDGYDPANVIGVDAHEPETPEQAEHDVQDALKGDKGAAARVNGVLNTITPDQVAGRAPLNAEQASVLSQLQAQEHGMSVDALSTAEQRLGDEKGLIGNSLQLMSNPNLTFPQTPLKVGANQGSETVKGGAAQLPDSVQQLLNAHWPDLRHMNQLAGIVKDGKPALQANTDLDRGMVKQASALMNNAFWRAGEGQPGDLKPNIDPTVSNVLSAVSPDHQVVHDAMTTGDHDRFLQNLTHHYWQDHGQAVSSLFSWTGDATQGPDARIAGETAHAYSSYIGGHQQDLLNLPGNHTLGQVNPNLVQGMAHGLGPYVDNIAGTTGGLPGFGGSLDSEGDTRSGALPIAKGVFSVIDSDQAAGQYFNGQAYAHAVAHEAAFGNETTHSGYDPQLYDAATLKGLVDVGTHNAYHANEVNGYHQQLAEYDLKKQAYEAGLTGLTTVAGLPPGVGTVASPALNVLGHGLENSILGPAPSAPGENPIQPMDIGVADQGMTNAMLQAGHNVTLPEGYVVYDDQHPHGRLATLDEVRTKFPGLTASQYDGVIGPALSQAIALPPDEKMSPDEWMTTRYDNVVGVPHADQGQPK